jgi:hypothetical protein
MGDHLGSNAGLVGSGGTIDTSYPYQPFGATSFTMQTIFHEY